MKKGSNPNQSNQVLFKIMNKTKKQTSFFWLLHSTVTILQGWASRKHLHSSWSHNLLSSSWEPTEKEAFAVRAVKFDNFPTSLELLCASVRSSTKALRLFVIYRPPERPGHPPFSTFLSDFRTLLESAVDLNEEPVMVGDFFTSTLTTRNAAKLAHSSSQ